MDKLAERKRLRHELTIAYRSQAEYVCKFNDPSLGIANHISDLRKELMKVDRWSIGKEDTHQKPPRRSARPKETHWHCAFPDCDKPMPPGTAAVKYKKRNYCSEKCAYADAEPTKKSITAKT